LSGLFTKNRRLNSADSKSMSSNPNRLASESNIPSRRINSSGMGW